MLEEPLSAAAVRQLDQRLLRGARDGCFERGRHGVPDGLLPRGREKVDAVLRRRFVHGALREGVQDGPLLRSELDDWPLLAVGTCDCAALRVHAGDVRRGLQRRDVEHGEGHGADGDAADDGEEVQSFVGWLVETAQEGGWREPLAIKHGDGVVEALAAGTSGQGSGDDVLLHAPSVIEHYPEWPDTSVFAGHHQPGDHNGASAHSGDRRSWRHVFGGLPVWRMEFEAAIPLQRGRCFQVGSVEPVADFGEHELAVDVEACQFFQQGLEIGASIKVLREGSHA